MEKKGSFLIVCIHNDPYGCIFSKLILYLLLSGIFKTSPPTPKKIIQERREADLDLTDRHTGD